MNMFDSYRAARGVIACIICFNKQIRSDTVARLFLKFLGSRFSLSHPEQLWLQAFITASGFTGAFILSLSILPVCGLPM